MSKILKAAGCVACVFALGFLAIGYALVQDELLVNGSLSIEGEPLPANSTFVFDSNYLKPESENAVYNVYGDTVDIVLFNNDGLDVTVGSLFYTIKTADGSPTDATLAPGEGADNILNGGREEPYTQENETYTLTYSGGKPASIIVTAEAHNSSRTETLTATFNFVSGDGHRYRITRDGNVVTLDIVIGKESPTNDISINCGELAPNNTYGLTLEWFDRTTYTIDRSKLEKDTHYTLLFFISGESQEINEVNDYTEIVDNRILLTK